MHLTFGKLEAVVGLSYNNVIEGIKIGLPKVEASKRSNQDEIADSS